MECIGNEVDTGVLVIGREINRDHYVLDQPAIETEDFPEIKSYLKRRLRNSTHCTYLWIYQMFSNLDTEDPKRKVKRASLTVAIVPGNCNISYE